jgi:hypothetical protein
MFRAIKLPSHRAVLRALLAPLGSVNARIAVALLGARDSIGLSRAASRNMRAAMPPRWLVAGVSSLALLVAMSSLGSIWEPSIYAKETASWAAQGFGQDVVNLLVIVPILLGCAWGVARASRGALLILAGVLIYLVYSFALYAFAMHFNALFLIYCATLGVAFYCLVDVGIYLRTQDGQLWFALTQRRTRIVGWFLIAIATLFYALWLSTVIPALIDGRPPASLAEAGLITNPVHILDLAIILPALAIGGVLVLARRASGYLLAPVMLAFNGAMTIAIVGMNVSMRGHGLPTEAIVVVAMVLVAIASTWMLVGFLRRIRPPTTLGWLDQPHRV